MIRKILPPILALSVMQAASAITFTNNISGVGPINSSTVPQIYPIYCLQNTAPTPVVTCPLSHGQSADPAVCSGNPWYAGGAIRFGGCGPTDTYLGYLDFNLSNGGPATFKSYQPLAGVHIIVSNPAVDASGNITGTIHYTPITPNPDIIDGNYAASNKYWQYVGFNLSGLEFSKTIDPTVIPNLSYEDSTGTAAQFSDYADVRSLLMMGYNTVRVPLRSSYAQWDGPKGKVDGEYMSSYVMPLLESLTQARITTIVDMHDYMRYSIFGKEYAGCVGSLDPSAGCPDGTINTNSRDWVGLWVKFYQKIKYDQQIDRNRLMFDLNNEPTGIPNDSVFTIQVAIIKALRAEGFTGYILVSGNNWDGLHSWFDTWKSQDGTKTYSNATLFSRANFIAAGITDLSKIIINVHQYLDSDFSGNHDNCQTNLTTTGPTGFNLDAFTNWLKDNSFTAMLTEFGAGTDKASCTTSLTNLMEYLKKYSTKQTGGAYGYLGWQIWGVGHGWGDYHLRVKPTSYQTTVLKKYLTAVSPMVKHSIH